jgi:hypothetical protein
MASPDLAQDAVVTLDALAETFQQSLVFLRFVHHAVSCQKCNYISLRGEHVDSQVFPGFARKDEGRPAAA